MTPDAVPELMMLLVPEPPRYGGSPRIIARPVEWNAADRCPRNPELDGPLDDLAVYARVGGCDDAKPAELWGWTIAYLSPFQTDLRRAEFQVQTLRRIARAMATYENAYGPVQTFAQYLAVAARAVGARRYCYEIGPHNSGTYSENAYEITSAPARWIDNAAAELATSPASAR